MDPLNTPNWVNIEKNLEYAPEILGGLRKEELQEALQTIKNQWENLQTHPLSAEGVRHIRPDNSNLARVIEINRKEIYVYNKGNKTPKLGTGLFKEVSSGVHLNTLKPVVQGTIRYETMLNKEGEVVTTADVIKEGVANEIRLQKLFQGREEVVQIDHTCTYKSKGLVDKIGITMECCTVGDFFLDPEDDEDVAIIERLDSDKANVLTIVRDMFSILEALEGMDVLHRDLKAENLFLTEVNGKLRLKVGDFGFSGTRQGEKERLSKGEGVGGTIEYASPEVIESQINPTPETIEKVCSPKTMVWSMGVVLYDFIVGDLPPFAYHDGIFSLTEDKLKKQLDAGLRGSCFTCLDDATLNSLVTIIKNMLQFNPDMRLLGSELKDFLP